MDINSLDNGTYLNWWDWVFSVALHGIGARAAAFFCLAGGLWVLTRLRHFRLAFVFLFFYLAFTFGGGVYEWASHFVRSADIFG